MRKSLMLLVAAFLLLSGFSSSGFAQGPVLVVTETVTEQVFHDQITIVGRTEGIIQSNIVAEISGKVSKINTGEGLPVSQGQTLITIDSKILKLNLEAKEAEAQQAKVQADLAATQKTRAIKLRKDNLISESGLDSAVTWDAMQTANFRQLDAERKKMQQDFENAQIKAPYSGYTGRCLTNIGEWVNPGQEVFEMIDLSKIKIIADLSERYFGHLKVGSTVIVLKDDDTSLKGVVTGISPSASEETHTYPVIIEVDNSKGILGGGMLVRVTLSLNEQFTSLAIPKDALIRQGNNLMVYTINEGKAAPIPVTVTSTSGKTLAVQSPMLQQNMAVITRGNERIYPGAAVTTGQDSDTENKNEQAPDKTAE